VVYSIFERLKPGATSGGGIGGQENDAKQ
jgi:hypothetical protein